MRSACIH
jgi:hypothetical protein